MISAVRSTLRRHRAVAVCTVAAVAATAAVTASAGSASAATNNYSANINGQWAGIAGSIGGGILGKLVSANLVAGEVDISANSTGLKQVNGAALPAGVKSAARADLLTGGISIANIKTINTEATAPVTVAHKNVELVGWHASPLIDASALAVNSAAAWGNSVTGAGKTGTVASVNGHIANISLLNLGSLLGAFKSLLPTQLQYPVVSLSTTDLRGQIKSTLNHDGTHGLVATGAGGLGDVQILGGAAHGGITLGLFSSDNGTKYVANAKVWATGKPGGAGCSYTPPKWIEVGIGNNTIGLPITLGGRITLPAKLGYLEANFTGIDHCSAAANGTSASVDGAGVGLRLHLQLPTGLDLADLVVSLPDLNNATVNVPVGGIR
ncbi:MAG: hypothetical protein JWQ77_3628 [Jatrophihabitans sp.]|nr:hypothetical protein [Jatrophihabitans sp.]